MTQIEMFGLAQAKRVVEDGLVDGVECPCCGQLCKLYRRKLNSAMAASLIYLVRIHLRKAFGEWTHVNELPILQGRHAGGDFAKLAYWGMILAAPNDDPDKRCSGLWKASEHGVAFARNQIRVPRFVYIFDDRMHGSSDEQTSIIEALGDRFSYTELMDGFPVALN